MKKQIEVYPCNKCRRIISQGYSHGKKILCEVCHYKLKNHHV
ncbi:MAG: hypothetical protein WC679_13745 [Bacteroidales bacterium]|jgi:hypothetical protein